MSLIPACNERALEKIARSCLSDGKVLSVKDHGNLGFKGAMHMRRQRGQHVIASSSSNATSQQSQRRTVCVLLEQRNDVPRLIHNCIWCVCPGHLPRSVSLAACILGSFQEAVKVLACCLWWDATPIQSVALCELITLFSLGIVVLARPGAVCRRQGIVGLKILHEVKRYVCAADQISVAVRLVSAWLYFGIAAIICTDLGIAAAGTRAHLDGWA